MKRLISDHLPGVVAFVILALAALSAMGDDTARIQKLLSNPDIHGQVFLPAGTYECASLGIPATVRYIRGERTGSENLTTLKLTADSGESTRVLNATWSLDTDASLTVCDLDFDMNRANQGWKGGFDLAHQGGIFLSGDKAKPGKLNAKLRNVTMRNGAGDGVYVYHQSTLDMQHCDFADIFRAALGITGKNSKTSARWCTFVRSGIDVEPNSLGDVVDVYLADITTHDFDIALTAGSKCLVERLTHTGGALALYCNPAADFRGVDSTSIGKFAVRLAGNSIFERWKFAAKPASRDVVIAVQWVHNSLKTDQRLTLSDCEITGPGRLGMDLGVDTPANRNQFRLRNVTITGTDGGAEAQKTTSGRQLRGLAWILDNATWNGMPIQ